VGVCHSSPSEFQGLSTLGRLDEDRPHEVGDEDEERCPEEKGTDRGEVVEGLQILGVLEHPAGWPRSPMRNMGKNVMLKKTNMHQKWIFPSLLFNVLPSSSKPEVQAGEEGEDQSAHDGVVEVSQHEEAPVHRHIDGTSERKTPVTPPMRKLKNTARQKSIALRI